ncbi:MAG: cupin domain-containing protein [Psychrobacter sp.]|nr:cupin domain-containing protein [Psychrobacter sp.]
MTALKLCLPEAVTPQQFLAEYWQKKPLLIKQGLPQLIDMFEPEDILGLALDEEALARLITQHIAHDKPKWTVKKSPLDETDLETVLAHADDTLANWTVLVQNLEQWSPELGQLWQAFDFIPQWQRDDIMVSYAPQGGSVGKHYDDYDVFLAQGFGQRRWQLGKFCDETTEFIEGQPIRIFDDLGEIIFDEVLQPGDVLYVPPKLAHYGVAVDDCLTFSFGFRRPNMMQLLDNLVDVATSDSTLFVPMLLEQDSQPSGELTEASISQIQAQLLQLLASSHGTSLIRQAVSETVSRRQYDILTPEEALDEQELMQALSRDATLQIDYSSRLIYHTDNDITTIYANGQLLDELSDSERRLLKRLANGEALNHQDIFDDSANAVAIDTLMSWLENGWVWLNMT